MSLYTTIPANADQKQSLFWIKDENASESQGHDRENTSKSSTVQMAGTGAGIGADISASQKMISATWGSILTSLLGMLLDSLSDPRHREV